MDYNNFLIEKNNNVQIIFEVSSFITSPTKLAIFNKNNNVIKGSVSPLRESHLIKYQATKNFDSSRKSEKMDSFSKVSKYFYDKIDFTEYSWIISDIDNYLKEKKIK